MCSEFFLMTKDRGQKVDEEQLWSAEGQLVDITKFQKTLEETSKRIWYHGLMKKNEETVDSLLAQRERKVLGSLAGW